MFFFQAEDGIRDYKVTGVQTCALPIYQRGSICKSENGEVWYGKYYPAPGARQKRVQLGRTAEIDEKQARTALDDIVAVLNRNPAHALGGEPVRRFVEQVY